MRPVTEIRPALDPRLGLSAIVGLVVVAIGVGLASMRVPAAGLVLFPALIALPAVIRWPELATHLVCFVLYSNAAVIAVQFHGVPFLLAAAFPAGLLIPLAARLSRPGERFFVAPILPLLFVFLGLHLTAATAPGFAGMRPAVSMRRETRRGFAHRVPDRGVTSARHPIA
jgi:hypothetical protein